MIEKIKLDYNSLEPYIDDETLHLHYDVLYQNYLNNLNRLLKENNYNFASIYDLLDNINSLNTKDMEDILYNLGGVVNHELYFDNMSTKGNNEPKGKLKDDIDIYFNSYEEFKELLKQSALKLKGSGFTFLVLDKDNNLIIMNTKNQDTPYYYGFTPIIALDLWEHSYYLKYKTNKSDYIDSWFKLLDFDKIGKVYEKSIK